MHPSANFLLLNFFTTFGYKWVSLAADCLYPACETQDRMITHDRHRLSIPLIENSSIGTIHLDRGSEPEPAAMGVKPVASTVIDICRQSIHDMQRHHRVLVRSIKKILYIYNIDIYSV